MLLYQTWNFYWRVLSENFWGSCLFWVALIKLAFVSISFIWKADIHFCFKFIVKSLKKTWNERFCYTLGEMGIFHFLTDCCISLKNTGYDTWTWTLTSLWILCVLSESKCYKKFLIYLNRLETFWTEGETSWNITLQTRYTKKRMRNARSQ